MANRPGGKGSVRRPCQVPQSEVDANFDRIWGKKDKPQPEPECPSHDSDFEAFSSADFKQAVKSSIERTEALCGPEMSLASDKPVSSTDFQRASYEVQKLRRVRLNEALNSLSEVMEGKPLPPPAQRPEK